MPNELALPDELTFAFLSKIGKRLAHELNNSIAAISSSAFLINEMVKQDDESLPFIDGIKEECEKLKSVAEEFSNYISTFPILKMPLDIVEFVRARAGEIAREGVDVKLILPDEKLFIDADPSMLDLALRNIVDFALSEGALSVTMEVEYGNDCSITIRDNRVPRRTAEYLSEAFLPIPSEGYRVRGLGLKLPFAARAIMLHGAAIEFVESPDDQMEIRIIFSRIQDTRQG